MVSLQNTVLWWKSYCMFWFNLFLFLEVPVILLIHVLKIFVEVVAYCIFYKMLWAPIIYLSLLKSVELWMSLENDFYNSFSKYMTNI